MSKRLEFTTLRLHCNSVTKERISSDQRSMSDQRCSIQPYCTYNFKGMHSIEVMENLFSNSMGIIVTTWENTNQYLTLFLMWLIVYHYH